MGISESRSETKKVDIPVLFDTSLKGCSPQVLGDTECSLSFPEGTLTICFEGSNVVFKNGKGGELIYPLSLTSGGARLVDDEGQLIFFLQEGKTFCAGNAELFGLDEFFGELKSPVDMQRKVEAKTIEEMKWGLVLQQAICSKVYQATGIIPIGRDAVEAGPGKTAEMLSLFS